jgi:ribonuclease HII
MTGPSREIEDSLYAEGFTTVVGIDEVGKGAWAGPLVVCAAVIPKMVPDAGDPKGVRDSKKIAEKKREAMFDEVAAWASKWSLGVVTNAECDELGMSRAQKTATKRALDGLGLTVPELVKTAAIADGKWNFVAPLLPRVEMRVKADDYSLSVATASILAKVSRDRMMREYAIEYPDYAFDTNKGYPCAKQRAKLIESGMCVIHRKSWNFMEKLTGESAEAVLFE